jgi:hypothetical protein
VYTALNPRGNKISLRAERRTLVICRPYPREAPERLGSRLFRERQRRTPRLRSNVIQNPHHNMYRISGLKPFLRLSSFNIIPRVRHNVLDMRPCALVEIIITEERTWKCKPSEKPGRSRELARRGLLYSSTLTMEPVRSSETSVDVYLTTQRHMLEGNSLHDVYY